MVWNACKLAGQATVSALSTINKPLTLLTFFNVHIEHPQDK